MSTIPRGSEQGIEALPPLARLQRRLTAWYVITVSTMLLVLGVALFFAVSRQIGSKLDDSLRRITASVGPALLRAQDEQEVADLFRTVKIPDRSLYLFDSATSLLSPDTASRWIRDAARRAARTGDASLTADIGREHTLQVRAARFNAHGRTFLLVASADTEEVEDEYAFVIAAFALAAISALALVAGGGYWLAHRSTAPIAASVALTRRFMADAAHELRTPVAVLRTRADVTLARPRERTEYESALREMRAEAERLGVILDDLFTLARADASPPDLQSQRVFLDDVALDVAQTARTMGAPRRITVDITDFRQAEVAGDPLLIRQLLMILLDNAVKYTGDDGRVTIGVATSDGRATFVVEDTGIGVPSDAIPHVFERFYRADTARKRGSGAGLGLAIAKMIADQHGATIQLSVRPSGGTRVEVAFPGV